MTLYEMTGELMQLVDMLADTEMTEEEKDAIIADNMEGFGADEKLDAYAKVITELNAYIDGCTKEIKRLTAIKTTTANSVERLVKALTDFMEAGKLEKVQTSLFKFTCKNTPDRVEVDDASLIPAEYFHEPKQPEVDKTAIKNALKLGIDIQGVHLTHDRRASFK